METTTDKCTRKLATDRSIANAKLPSKYHGEWSYYNLGVEQMSPFVPWGDGFVAYMNAQPFITIAGGKVTEREELAAALLKRTFAYNFTHVGWNRALFADAFTTFGKPDHELAEDLEDLAQIRTLVLLEMQNVSKRTHLEVALRQRNDKGRYTILTVPRVADIPLVVGELLRDSARIVTIGG